MVAVKGFLAAFQEDFVVCLKRQHSRFNGDIGARLVNNHNRPERCRFIGHLKAIVYRNGADHPVHRVVLGKHFP